MSPFRTPYDHGAVVEQIMARIRPLRAGGWNVFVGVEAIDILRKHAAIPGSIKPKLWVHCQHSVDRREKVHEDFIPQVIAIDGPTGTIEIHGTNGQGGRRTTLYYDSLKLADESGLYVSFVAARPQDIGWRELAQVELTHIR